MVAFGTYFGAGQTYRASGDDWAAEFNLGDLNSEVITALKVGIDTVTKESAVMAISTHGIPHQWTIRTGQTLEAVGTRKAEWDPIERKVWGTWYVASNARTSAGGDEVANATGERHDVLTTRDVALFLEFGTAKAAPFPWIYPVFDAMKGRFLDAVRTAWESGAKSGPSFVAPRRTGFARGYSQFHAPAGGITIGGKRYTRGQFLPNKASGG
jgi:hypothetical protein